MFFVYGLAGMAYSLGLSVCRMRQERSVFSVPGVGKSALKRSVF